LGVNFRNVFNDYSQLDAKDSTPMTQCNYCTDTFVKIDLLTEILHDYKHEKYEMVMELIEKEGIILLYEEKMKKMRDKIIHLEK
jgi:predicted nucleotide-binding protein (sugar kinase/HSP70/actin superfamily)